jgi:hypothetical protein
MPAAKAARLQRLPRPRRLQTLPTFSPSIAHQGYERPGAKKLDLHQAVNQAPCCRPSVRVDSESDHRCRGPAKYLGRPASTLGTEAAPSLIRHPDLCGFAAERPQRDFVPVSGNVRFQDAIPSRERPLRVNSYRSELEHRTTYTGCAGKPACSWKPRFEGCRQAFAIYNLWKRCIDPCCQSSGRNWREGGRSGELPEPSAQLPRRLTAASKGLL